MSTFQQRYFNPYRSLPFLLPFFCSCTLWCWQHFVCIKTQLCFLWFYWFLFELTSQLFDKSSSPHFENFELLKQHLKQTLKDTRVDGVVQLTNDICEQQGQGEREEWCRQSCALPVAAAVRLVEGKQWSGHTAARERTGRRRVHGSRCKRVALSCPWQ